MREQAVRLRKFTLRPSLAFFSPCRRPICDVCYLSGLVKTSSWPDDDYGFAQLVYAMRKRASSFSGVQNSLIWSYAPNVVACCMQTALAVFDVIKKVKRASASAVPSCWASAHILFDAQASLKNQKVALLVVLGAFLGGDWHFAFLWILVFFEDEGCILVILIFQASWERHLCPKKW